VVEQTLESQHLVMLLVLVLVPVDGEQQRLQFGGVGVEELLQLLHSMAMRCAVSVQLDEEVLARWVSV
jgi:hypothetical protein